MRHGVGPNGVGGLVCSPGRLRLGLVAADVRRALGPSAAWLGHLRRVCRLFSVRLVASRFVAADFLFPASLLACSASHCFLVSFSSSREAPDAMGLLSDAQVKGILVSKDYLVLYGTFDWLWQTPEERIAASCVAVYDRNLKSFVSMSPGVWGAGAYADVWKEYGKSFFVAGQEEDGGDGARDLACVGIVR